MYEEICFGIFATILFSLCTILFCLCLILFNKKTVPPTCPKDESLSVTRSGCGLMDRLYRTTSNLTDVSNYSDSFANYFLTSNCTIHLKFVGLVIL